MAFKGKASAAETKVRDLGLALARIAESEGLPVNALAMHCGGPIRVLPRLRSGRLCDGKGRRRRSAFSCRSQMKMEEAP